MFSFCLDFSSSLPVKLDMILFTVSPTMAELTISAMTTPQQIDPQKICTGKNLVNMHEQKRGRVYV
jgi:tRNA A37 threonylcarbamoyladenosine dehydratase